MSPRRAQFTPRMIPLLLLDAFGMALFGAGLLFLSKGAALFGGFPSSMLTAVVCLLLGVATMIYAVAGILREMLRSREAGASKPGEAA